MGTTRAIFWHARPTLLYIADVVDHSRTLASAAHMSYNDGNRQVLCLEESCSAHFIADASILQRWEQHEPFGTRGPLRPYIANVVDHSSTLASAAHMSYNDGNCQVLRLARPTSSPMRASYNDGSNTSLLARGAPTLQPQAVRRHSLDATRRSLRAQLRLQPRAAMRVLRQARPKDASSSASAAHVIGDATSISISSDGNDLHSALCSSSHDPLATGTARLERARKQASEQPASEEASVTVRRPELVSERAKARERASERATSEQASERRCRPRAAAATVTVRRL